MAKLRSAKPKVAKSSRTKARMSKRSAKKAGLRAASKKKIGKRSKSSKYAAIKARSSVRKAKLASVVRSGKASKGSRTKIVRVRMGADSVTRYKVSKHRKAVRLTLQERPRRVRWHRVKRGETLWGIARKYYGKGSYSRHLLEANRQRISDPRKLRPRQRIALV